MITMVFSLIFLKPVLTVPSSTDLKVCELTQAGIEHLDKLTKTKTNLTCLHWDSLKEMDDLFKPLGDSTTCQNFCSNLDKHLKGAYCVVRDTNNDFGFSSEHCLPKFCGLNDHDIFSTDNDYFGQFKTRIKRKSAQSTNHSAKANYSVKIVLEDTKNSSKDWKIDNEEDLASALDSKTSGDSCFVDDPDKPVGCTVLTSLFSPGAHYYILPLWRKYGLHFWLRAWNPDIFQGLIISLATLDGVREYQLVIGDENNEKVKLFYKQSGSEYLLEQNTLSHLVPAGKWAGYWLKPGFGKIELGYQGVSYSFFEWTSPDEDFSFEPMIINFGTLKNNWIGVSFPCTECLTAKISIAEENKRYPINLWRGQVFTSELRLNLRGTGSAIVTLMWTKDFYKSLAVQIFSNRRSILILQYLEDDKFEILADFPVSEIISDDVWSEYVISYSTTSLCVSKDGVLLLTWESPFQLLFYWFSVTSEDGSINWSANCSPADIDGEPRDGNWGKWGPWSCSVSCGKGEGRISRQCNDPPPNVFGHYCEGPSVYYGPCNDFPCGEISPTTTDIIRNYLSTQHKSFYVDAKEKVVLTCNSKAVELVSAEVNELNISWTHNGFPFCRTRLHMDENYSLVIPHTHEKHNGIYMCLAYQSPKSILPEVVLDVVSLVVIKPKPTKKVRKGRSFSLKCNGLPLSYVYADLSQKWELNGQVWKDYGLGNLHTYTVDKLENISYNHAGIWTCVVIQEDFRFKWTTNWIYLSVTTAPSFWSNLKEDVSNALVLNKFGVEKNSLILILVIGGTCISVALILFTIFILKSLNIFSKTPKTTNKEIGWR